MSAWSKLPVALGQALSADPEALRDALARWGDEDAEAAHGAEDGFLRHALAVIRDGHPDPCEVARVALIVAGADYDRWYA